MLGGRSLGTETGRAGVALMAWEMQSSLLALQSHIVMMGKQKKSHRNGTSLSGVRLRDDI